MLARGWVVGYSDEMNFNLTKIRRLPEALSLSALLRCARGRAPAGAGSAPISAPTTRAFGHH